MPLCEAAKFASACCAVQLDWAVVALPWSTGASFETHAPKDEYAAANAVAPMLARSFTHCACALELLPPDAMPAGTAHNATATMNNSLRTISTLLFFVLGH